MCQQSLQHRWEQSRAGGGLLLPSVGLRSLADKPRNRHRCAVGSRVPFVWYQILFLSLFFPSLMDREVALLAEMDKVKAEASKAPALFQRPASCRCCCALKRQPPKEQILIDFLLTSF